MNYSLLRSKTFWTAVALAAVNIINAFVPFMPAGWQTAADVVGTILITIFHLDTAMRSGATN